jgi:1-acyl-sn-glycerol-3-phosphate acyltransferase
MRVGYWLANAAMKRLTRILCRIDDEQLVNVPARGPLIVVANHVNFWEVPIMYTHLLPRPITGFVKSENWDKPATRFLFSMWGAIPLRRGTADVDALRQGLEALKNGKILAISPEGTRSGNGLLQECHPGVVLVALRSGAPILPLVYYGSENYMQYFRRLRRPPFRIIVGRPFRLEPGGVKVTREVRQQMLDEIMFQVAALLPQEYRGVYSDMSAATFNYLAPMPQVG